MKFRQLLPLLLASAIPLMAALTSDTVSTSQGPLKITPIKHASVMLEFGGNVIHIDPWSQGDYTGLPKADVIFITDIHGDHMDPAKIAEIKKDGTVIVAPAAVAKTVTEATVINNGESKTIAGIQVEAVPMYNLVRGPSAGKLFHDKGRGNGYVLTLGGKRIYFSGDTEAVPEMKAFKPKIVYPYHYRNSDLNVFTNALKDEKGIEVRLRSWY